MLIFHELQFVLCNIHRAVFLLPICGNVEMNSKCQRFYQISILWTPSSYEINKILHQKIRTGNKKHFLKIPSEETSSGEINVIHTKTQALITHMLNADNVNLAQTVTDTIEHTSTRDRLYGDMPRTRLSTMYNCAICLLSCLFKSSGNACNNSNKMNGQLNPTPFGTDSAVC
jgi:hypothetical protein